MDLKINLAASGCNLRNNSPTFKGTYILKGVRKDVSKARDMISSMCADEYNRMRYKGKKFFPGFKDFEYLNLTDIYGDMQRDAKCLIATNEHCPNVINWNLKYRPPKDIPIIPCPYTHQPINMDQIIEIAEKMYAQIEQKRAPYNHAVKCEKYGNDDPMCDFLIDSYKQAKECLQQFKDSATVAMGEIKELDVKEVLQAIRENRFNFISGVITK